MSRGVEPGRGHLGSLVVRWCPGEVVTTLSSEAKYELTRGRNRDERDYPLQRTREDMKFLGTTGEPNTPCLEKI